MRRSCIPSVWTTLALSTTSALWPTYTQPEYTTGPLLHDLAAPTFSWLSHIPPLGAQWETITATTTAPRPPLPPAHPCPPLPRPSPPAFSSSSSVMRSRSASTSAARASASASFCWYRSRSKSSATSFNFCVSFSAAPMVASNATWSSLACSSSRSARRRCADCGSVGRSGTGKRRDTGPWARGSEKVRGRAAGRCVRRQHQES